MNIALVNLDGGVPLFSPKGGAVHFRDFAAAAATVGHHVRLFTAESGPPIDGWRLPYVVLPGPTVAADRSTEERQLARNRPMFAALSDEHRRHPIDLVYERYSLWSHDGLAFARRHGLPFVLEVNSPLIAEQSRYRTLHRRATARRIERYLLKGATRIVAVSSQVAAHVCQHGAAPDRVVVASNGVDLSLYATPLPRTQTAGCFTIGFLGSLKPWHGLDVLIEAFAALVAGDDRFRLRLIGDGPERTRIMERLNSQGLARQTTAVGQVDRSEVPSQLAHVDCAVAPYPRLPDFYFSPLKVFEYMAAGCPIVASRIGQIESVLSHGQTAVLVDPGDAQALASAIRTLRDRPDVAQRLSTAAQRQAFCRHGWTHTVATALRGLEATA